MNKAITDSIKFICCIGIFIHHFYLHSPYVGFLGPTACVIFFFLSAYGISVSFYEVERNGCIHVQEEWHCCKMSHPNVLAISMTEVGSIADMISQFPFVFHLVFSAAGTAYS